MRCLNLQKRLNEVMVKIKTSELTGAALDRAVSVAQGYDYDIVDGQVVTGMSVLITSGDFAGCHTDEVFSPSTDWAQGGPIIDRERISIRTWTNTPVVHAYMPKDGAEWSSDAGSPLIAAMRCYVASKLGDEVEIPDALAG